MKLLIFFLFISSLGLSQSIDEPCQVHHSTYKVIVKNNAYPGYDSKMVIPRLLTDEEKCLIISLRREDEDVVYSLDDKHEVLIISNSNFKTH